MSGNENSGRPRKPVALHLQEGTYREDRHGGRMQGPSGLLEIPPDLAEKYHESFNFTVEGLSRVAGLLSLIDVDVISKYAVNRTEYFEAVNRGDFREARKFEEAMNKAHRQLGMSPADRARIPSAPRPRLPSDCYQS